jgi:hypothetical protein
VPYTLGQSETNEGPYATSSPGRHLAELEDSGAYSFEKNDVEYDYDPSSLAGGALGDPTSPGAMGEYASDDGDLLDDDDGELLQEDLWTVISSFFEDKGLVTQQLESFNEFVENSMQELVDEEGNLTLDQYDQHTGHEQDETSRYELSFGQIYLSKTTMTESDGTVNAMFPQEARLRNLTCVLWWPRACGDPRAGLLTLLLAATAATRPRSTST